ncbi:MAG: hypothetical protein A3F68_08040 [Acidobacteria bacterium RIFCSPLOWO2_12_FULL_54_10]|nr:MAG: hypothetical protein A3F68_08040 [Acidobacteria bacterium RIFCSPLOWO2_12_FULL_54_10]
MANSSSKNLLQIAYDPVLVEETILLRIRNDPEEKRFWRARNLIYEVPETEERESRFQKFHFEWFHRMRLAAPLLAALDEQPEILQQVRHCSVIKAPTNHDEGADLHDLRDPEPDNLTMGKALLIQLKPARLLEQRTLQEWLRHELMHIADMLNPHFGYKRFDVTAATGPAWANRVRDRYRVLWNTWVDGRMVRRGWLAAQARQRRLEEFLAVFGSTGPVSTAVFNQVFEAESQTHERLMNLSNEAEGSRSNSADSRSASRPCPLCRFPYDRLLPADSELSENVRDRIRAEFSDWRPEDCICEQCADLYRTREMSLTALAALPHV